MGVSLQVESILTSAARRPASGPRLEDLNRDKRAVVDNVKRALGVNELPWEEPSDRAGATRASLGQSTYGALTALPFEHDLDDAMPHLLDHDSYWTIYLPVELERPRAFEGGPFGSYVIASAPRLVAELERLRAARGDAPPHPTLETVLGAAREAVALALPLHVRW